MVDSVQWLLRFAEAAYAQQGTQTLAQTSDGQPTTESVGEEDLPPPSSGQSQENDAVLVTPTIVAARIYRALDRFERNGVILAGLQFAGQVRGVSLAAPPQRVDSATLSTWSHSAVAALVDGVAASIGTEHQIRCDLSPLQLRVLISLCIRVRSDRLEQDGDSHCGEDEVAAVAKGRFHPASCLVADVDPLSEARPAIALALLSRDATGAGAHAASLPPAHVPPGAVGSKRPAPVPSSEATLAVCKKARNVPDPAARLLQAWNRPDRLWRPGASLLEPDLRAAALASRARAIQQVLEDTDGIAGGGVVGRVLLALGASQGPKRGSSAGATSPAGSRTRVGPSSEPPPGPGMDDIDRELVLALEATEEDGAGRRDTGRTGPTQPVVPVASSGTTALLPAAAPSYASSTSESMTAEAAEVSSRVGHLATTTVAGGAKDALQELPLPCGAPRPQERAMDVQVAVGWIWGTERGLALLREFGGGSLPQLELAARRAVEAHLSVREGARGEAKNARAATKGGTSTTAGSSEGMRRSLDEWAGASALEWVRWMAALCTRSERGLARRAPSAFVVARALLGLDAHGSPLGAASGQGAGGGELKATPCGST